MSISIVQTASITGGGGSSISGSFSQATTAGNTLIFAISAFATAAFSVSSANYNQGASVNPLTQVIECDDAGNGGGDDTPQVGAIWYAQDILGGIQNAAVNFSHSIINRQLFVWEVAGLPTAGNIIDQTAGDNTPSYSAIGLNPAISMTLGNAGDFCVCITPQQGFLTGPGTGWTQDVLSTGSAVEHQIASSSGVLSCGFQSSSSGQAPFITYAMVAAAFSMGGIVATTGWVQRHRSFVKHR